MDLLVDIVLYGTGAVALIFVVLVLIGLVAGVTSFVQAYRYEVRQQRSLIHSRRTMRHEDGTKPSVLTEGLIYPSRTFDKDSLRLIDQGLPFVITVPASSRKRAVVERELPQMVYLHSSEVSLWRSFVDKLRTSGLWACVAYAVVDDKYAVSYVADTDITIRFEPVSWVPGEASALTLPRFWP